MFPCLVLMDEGCEISPPVKMGCGEDSSCIVRAPMASVSCDRVVASQPSARIRSRSRTPCNEISPRVLAKIDWKPLAVRVEYCF